MKRKVKIIVIAMTIVAALVTLSCNRGSNAQAAGVTPTRDLRGANILIGTYYADYNVNNVTPATENDQRTLAWRTGILERYGFQMEQKLVAPFAEIQQLATTSIMAGDPVASVITLDQPGGMALIRQGLAFPVTDNTAVDIRNPQPVEPGARVVQWNQATIDAFTVGGKGYSFSFGVPISNAAVVFFNKRLFAEAGLDPNLPYTMQREGTWTWDNFLNVCRQLTRDSDNDGIIDVYALASELSEEILEAALSSNGAMWVDKDANGRFVNATNRPEFMEALQFVLRLRNEGYMRMKPEGTPWNWHIAAFLEGQFAMRIDESYVWASLSTNMRDDWGVVTFPRGPRMNTYRLHVRDNAWLVPATFSLEEVNNIMYALALWNTPVDDGDWRAPYYNVFRDQFAIDETLVIIRNPEYHHYRTYNLIPGFQRGRITWNMWTHQGDPAQLIESASANWNTLIQESNADLNR